MEGKWCESYFLGFYWKTSEALVGTQEGVTRAGTIPASGGTPALGRRGLGQNPRGAVEMGP